MMKIKFNPEFRNVYLEIEQYNEEAAKIEAELKQRCPLVEWSVSRVTKEDYKDNAFILYEFSVRAEIIINRQSFKRIIRLERRAWRLMIDPFSVIIGQTVHHLVHSIVNFRDDQF